MIKKSTAVGVPGIPDAALNAISDENTRVVLRAIADGLNVRNGFAGNGDSAFLTKGDLSQNGIVGSLIADALNSAAKAGNGITPGQVPIIINALQTAIMETRLFKDLGDRVELIDKPGGIFDRLDATELVLKEETDQRVENDTAISESVNAIGVRVGESEAAIKEESTLRASADNALSETISTQYTSIGQSLALAQDRITTVANSVAAETQKTTQLQASVNGLSSAISTESEARASADGTLYAQTYIKLDVNGRVAGMGLANDGKVSDFIVRADRFSIASPTGTDANGKPIAPTMPFVVVTTPTSYNGAAIPPGVYMNTAFIADATITRAKIGVAEIDTLRLAGTAVTVSTCATSSTNHGWPAGSGTAINTTPRTVVSTAISTGDLGGSTAGTIIMVTANLLEGGGDGATIELGIYVDGSKVAHSGCTLGSSQTLSAVGFANLWEGNHTIEAKLYTTPSAGGSWSKNLACIASLVCMSGKR